MFNNRKLESKTPPVSLGGVFDVVAEILENTYINSPVPQSLFEKRPLVYIDVRIVFIFSV